MTLKTLKEICSGFDNDDLSEYDEVFIDMDRSILTVGADKYGMRLLKSDDIYDYATLEDLVNDNCYCFISDGQFDIFIPEGEPTKLLIDIDDFEVDIESDIMKELGIE